MAKIGIAATKYIIKAKITANGVVERPDVIGAIFGQTEGLLGEELELRELQKGGRIGRIEVNVTSKEGKSEGNIEIPTSLSRDETALIAAALETIDRIGPCDSKIVVEAIEDVRNSKRDFVVDRAKQLLDKMGTSLPESQELSDMVREKSRIGELQEHGPDKLPAGPDIGKSAEVILVEGRADVINLLRYNLTNALGVGGTNIPKSVADICKNKKVTVFLDGDRGGDLILKGLSQMLKVDFVARAPPGREVEEITQKEILKALRNKVAFGEKSLAAKQPEKSSPAPKPIARTITPIRRPILKRSPATTQSFKPAPILPPEEVKALGKIAKSLEGSGNACLLKQQANKNFREVGKVPKRELSNVLKNLQKGKAQALIVDWNIDQSLVNESASAGIIYLIGPRKPYTLKRKPGMRVLETRELGGGQTNVPKR